jgi:hypothetical protein
MSDDWAVGVLVPFFCSYQVCSFVVALRFPKVAGL